MPRSDPFPFGQIFRRHRGPRAHIKSATSLFLGYKYDTSMPIQLEGPFKSLSRAVRRYY